MSDADLTANRGRRLPEVRFMTLDPGHFHAALVQKEMYPGVVAARRTSTRRSAPICSSTWAASRRSTRGRDSPTAWQLEVHAGPRLLRAACSREKPGNVVVCPGRNRGKIDRIAASVARRPERARRQAVDSAIRRSADARGRAGRRRREAARRLRHHDRAVRGHDDPAARAGQRPGTCSASLGTGTPERAGRLHGEHPPPDEGRRGRAEHPAGRGSSTPRSRARA